MTELSPMTDFTYRNGELHAEDVPLSRIAGEVGTPFYCYSSAGIERQATGFLKAFADQPATIHYTVKANSNLAVIRLLAKLGVGADVVSEGELRRALAAGVPAGKIVFSGVGKSAEEMEFALGRDIFQINVESEPELRLLSAVASRMGKTARIALRVNPDVDARTHAKISTGKKENKFGIEIDRALEIYRLAADLPGISPQGIAVHIGSQLTRLSPFDQAFQKVAELVRQLRADGLTVSQLDLGGGIGISYRGETPPDPADYAQLVKRVTKRLDVSLSFEPGRFIVGNAGILVSRILYVKQGLSRRFVIQDAAMNDLIRPSLYEAWHEIVPVKQAAAGSAQSPVDIVGPVCETGDTFATERPLSPVESGDLLAILSAGAYGATMSSSYNTRLLAPEVLVRGSDFAVIRPRPSFEELLSQDKIPDWLGQG